MTITMTAKHQITIPKVIADRLGLGRGTLFTIAISRNRIELIPLETIEKVFTDEEYAKLDALAAKERGHETRVTNAFIRALKTAKG